MKINKKILSIPPYISSGWEHVATLRLKSTDLIIQLVQGDLITIPDLKPETLESIFDFHATFMEEKENSARFGKHSNTPRLLQSPSSNQLSPGVDSIGESIFKIGIGSPDGINAAMQHSPELADSPDLPSEVLEKIGAISKIIAPEDIVIPKAELHCNCPYCQIARAIQGNAAVEFSVEQDEEVSVEELQFQEWDITQSGEKLFTVVNKLDSLEKYSVYLGHPVGCTCGKEGCEHILAVLKS